MFWYIIGWILASNKSFGLSSFDLFFTLIPYRIAVIVPSISLSVRRLHDTNRSGSWLFISLIPVIGVIVLLLYFTEDSKPIDNQYASSQNADVLQSGIIEYAGFWRRLGAILFDIIIIWVLGRFIFMVIWLLFKITNINYWYGIQTTVAWLYFTLLESSSKQATLGKMLTGIIVTDSNNHRISLGRANIRYWSKILSTISLWVGFIIAGFTKKKQAMHDIISETIVQAQ
jgi:uncharacterized RDD family membrane protein YckC